MKVKFVDPEVQLIGVFGDDSLIAKAARVSYGNFGKNKTEIEDSKLIYHLAREGHKSPFNHTFVSMYVKAPLFVARQMVKHRFMPWNETSRRYRETEFEFYNICDDMWRERHPNKKQGSLPTFVSVDSIDTAYDYSFTTPEKIAADALCLYNNLISAKVAPEQARMVLPQFTMTEWVWSGTLGAWADMFNLRKGDDVQKETRDIAFLCGLLIEETNKFPSAWKALTNG